MAWVRFPDGSRRKVKRQDKVDAERDLNALLAQRANEGTPGASRQRGVTFEELIKAWTAAGCPAPPDSRRGRHVTTKGVNTMNQIATFMNGRVIPEIGNLWVERTSIERVEVVFQKMEEDRLATDTIHRTWRLLNHASLYGLRRKLIKSSPVGDVVLPEKRTAKERKAFSLDEVQRLIFKALPNDARPAMWITALMCGLRPGELAGLRWCYVDLEAEKPTLAVMERAHEENKRYVGQRDPKGGRRSKRTILLPPMVAAALAKHRGELRLLNLYRVNDEPYAADGFVFPTRNNTPLAINNIRRYFQDFCKKAGVGDNWTTYEMRHSFVSLATDQLQDLMAVSDVVGHMDTRTTEGYRHIVRPALNGALLAWERLLAGEEETQPVPIRTTTA